jgi:hypothetical protein
MMIARAIAPHEQSPIAPHAYRTAHAPAGAGAHGSGPQALAAADRRTPPAPRAARGRRTQRHGGALSPDLLQL